MQIGSSLLPPFVVPGGWGRYVVGLVRRLLNRLCLIGAEIAPRSIGERGLVSLVLSWDDIKLTRLVWTGIVLIH